MAPTTSDLPSPTSMTPELRRAAKRPTRHPVVNRRGKAWPRRARIALADSPGLYMREEMT